MFGWIKSWGARRRADYRVLRWCMKLASAIRRGELDSSLRDWAGKGETDAVWSGQPMLFRRRSALLSLDFLYWVEIGGVELRGLSGWMVTRAVRKQSWALWKQRDAARRRQEREAQRRLAQRLS